MEKQIPCNKPATREYVDFVVKAVEQDLTNHRLMEERIEANMLERFQGIDKGTAIATIALDKRLDAMNEFRDQLRDQATTFLTLDVYGAKHQTLENQVEELTRRLEKTEALKQGAANNWLLIVGLVGFFAAVLALILNALRLFSGHS